MAQDPTSLRRIRRRQLDYQASPTAANLSALRASYGEYISDLKQGRGSYSDKERRAALNNASAQYSKLVGANRTNPDPLLPIGSDQAVQSLLPPGKAPAVTTAPVSPVPTVTPAVPARTATTGSGRSGSRRVRPPVTPAASKVSSPNLAAFASDGVTQPGVNDIVSPAVAASTTAPMNPSSIPGMLPITSDSPAATPTGLPANAVAGAAGLAGNPAGADGDGKSPIDWFGTALDAAGLLAGASGIKALPSYQLPPEMQLYLNRVKAQSYQGLTPEQNTAANQGIQQDFATSLAQARGLTGGGGSATEATANGLDAASRVNAARLNLGVANSTAQRQNLAAYGQSLGIPLSVDQGNFERQYNQQAAQNNNNAALIQQSAQNLAQRPYEHENDDLYNQLLQATVDRQRNASDALRRRNQLGINGL